MILLDSLCSSRPEAGRELRRCVLDLAAGRFHLDRLGGGAEEEEEEEGDEDNGKKNSVIKLLAAEAASAYDSGPRCCLSAEVSLETARARAAVDVASGGWLRAASRLLAEMTSRSSSSSSSSSSPAPCSSSSSSFAFRHFLVTAAPLAPTLAKLMVCGLSGFFPSAAVRCCWKKEKKRGYSEENGGGGGRGHCRCRKAVEFEALQREVEREEEEDDERKGGERRRLLFLAVGNSLGDELAAEAAGWPFVRVGPRAVGKEFGNNGAANADNSADGDGTSSSSPSSTKEKTRPPRPDALGRVSTPMTRLTLLDLMRAAGALGGG